MSFQANKLGKYDLVREIARSNDIVYEAKDPILGRTVALKELNIPSSLQGSQRRERIERFYREARAAGNLDHPNIVTIFDVGEDSGRHYIAMEFLTGTSLADRIKMTGPMSPEEAVKVSQAVLDGLAFAHRHGVIHRDIKPDNIQLLADGQVKITDFGIARFTQGPQITADGQIFGTPSYMSPEQVKGLAVDHRSDIFSFGVVLYEMLTGSKPFTGDSVITITYNITSSEPFFSRQVPANLEQVIRRALRKEPAHRFQSADEMKQALLGTGNVPPLIYAAPMQHSAPTLYPGVGLSRQLPPHLAHGIPNIHTGPAPLPAQIPQLPPGARLPDPLKYYRPRRSLWQSLNAQTRGFIVTSILAIALAVAFVGMILMLMRVSERFEQQYVMELVNEMVEKGNEFVKAGQFEKALEQFSKAKQKVSNSPVERTVRHSIAVLYCDLAEQSRNNGDYPKALLFSENAVSEDPNLAAARFSLGTERARQGYLDEAALQYEQGAELFSSGSQERLSRESVGGNFICLGDMYLSRSLVNQAARMYELAAEYARGTTVGEIARQRFENLR